MARFIKIKQYFLFKYAYPANFLSLNKYFCKNLIFIYLNDNITVVNFQINELID
jgi:hypothetical protein